jgi:hypothetical protein
MLAMNARRMIEAVFIRRVVREFSFCPESFGRCASAGRSAGDVDAATRRGGRWLPVYSNLSPALLPLSTRDRLVETSTGEPPDKEPTK